MALKTKEVTAPTKATISERVKRLREATLATIGKVSADRSHIVTEYYKRSDGESAVLRRANAFKEVLKRIPIAIGDDELIVGSLTDRVRGVYFYPEYSYKFLKEEWDILLTSESDKVCVAKEDTKIILEDAEYWVGRSVEDKLGVLVQEQYGPIMQDLREERLIHVEGLMYPNGRKMVDYPKVLNIGLNGVLEEARRELNKINIISYEDLPKRYFLQAVIISLEGMISFAQRHAALARELAAREKEPTRKQELERIAEVCEWVPANPARTFHEALQSFWFTHLGCWIEASASGYSPGRFDQYMYPFYERDKREGRLTREQTLELMGCLWVKFNQFPILTSHMQSQISAGGGQFQNVTIGGITRDKKSAVNELSYLILDVTEQLRLPQPTVSVRYNDNLPEDFLLRAAEIVRLGGGMPAWFNDKYAAAVLPYYGVPPEESWDWCPFGCVEIGICPSIAPQHNLGAYSVAKCLELALNNGLDPGTKKQLGPVTGDARQFKTYEELFGAVKTQIANAINKVLLYRLAGYALHAELVPTPYSSALINDCIKKGKDITQGGARYNNFMVLEPHGFANTANSLYAIKKLVFEDKAISMEELLDTLAVNFEGKEELRSMLEAVPKYGNGGDEVEQVMSGLFQFTTREGKKYRGPFGNPIETVFLGITYHYYFGTTIGALPDGRKAYTPTTDGALSAFPGTDKKGPTALIHSAVKVDAVPALSTLLNIKFHPTALSGREGLKKLLSLIKTYFDLGFDSAAYHIQFNVVSRETLLEAKKDPHLYHDLLVRIAGFTVFWVDLPPAIQDEIIARTEYNF